MNLRRVALAAALTLMAAGTTDAQPPTPCATHWLPSAEAALRIAAIDGGDAALMLGDTLIARVRGEPPRLFEAQEPESAIGTAAIERVADELRVRGALALDATCSVDLDRVAVRAPVNATALARALETLGAARRAQQAQDREKSAAVAIQALRQLPRTAQPPLRAELAAFAIERLLEAGLTAQARELFDEAAGLLHEPEPAHPSAVRLALAHARLLSFETRVREALALRERVHAQAENLFGPASEDALWNRLRIANLNSELGRYDASLGELSALRPRIEAAIAPGHPLRVAALRAFSAALGLSGRSGESLAVVQQLHREIAGAFGEDDRRAVDFEEQVARGLGAAGRFEEALAAAARVYLWRHKRLGADSVPTLDIAAFVSQLYGVMGRFGSARVILRDVLARNAVVQGSRSDLQLRGVNQLAGWTLADGDVELAARLSAQAFEATREALGDDSPYTQGVAYDHGLSLLRNGDIEEACLLLRQTHDRIALTRPDDLLMRGQLADALGRCLLARTDRESIQQARDLLETGSRALAAAEGEGSTRALGPLAALAAAELRLGRRAEAKALLQQFVALSEGNRARAAPGSVTRESSFSLRVAETDENAGYRTLAWLHAEDGELDEALRVVELARDRRLRDRFSERGLHKLRLAPGERHVLNGLTDIRQRLDEEIAMAESVPETVRLEAERVEANAALNRLQQAIVAREGAKHVATAPTVAQLQAQLARGTALVALQRGGRQWWALVIPAQGRPRAIALDGTDRVDAAARAWRSRLRREPVRVWRLDDDRWTVGFTRPAHAIDRIPPGDVETQLAKSLFEPLLRTAPEATRLVIVVDETLAGLPFEALPLASKGAATAPLALARYEIRYAPSLTHWYERQRIAAPRDWTRDLFAVAAVDAAPIAGKVVTDSTNRIADEHGLWQPLPHARAEIAAIQRLFAAHRVRITLDGAVAKSRLIDASRSGQLARFRYVHFATHAFVEPRFAERSALVFATGRSSAPADRMLNAIEFAGLDMGSELVVLSACDTGGGRFDPGLGLLGFAYSVLAAGNRAAVLSLWPVEDQSTARFMESYYKRLRKGQGPSAALTATKRAFARSADARERDRRAWAPFVLFGE